ncbi:MAG: hypothetical protein HY748_06600 [Elusimicrobia bacterium]|nr:hypothetical protein [Elusimicrobiota bacterium]
MDLTAGPFTRLPFLNGAYIAVDAVPGAFLVVDGPYCVFTKAEMQYCHNFRCRLIPPLGRCAVVHTAARTGMEEVTSLSADRLTGVEAVFDQVCGYPEARVVFATSFDFHELLNFPLADVARKAGRRSGKLVCPIPSGSLGAGWLDGYSRACEALARGIPLSPGKAGRDTVAVVGYLFDRDEPDHAGNLRELRRLLAGLGLRLVSVWLSGVGTAALRKVETASLILSLPYARGAARALGRRLRVRVIEAGLPLGLTNTERFLTSLARALGRLALARRFLDREVPAAADDTQAHVSRIIRGRAAVLRLPDPHLRRALQGLCADLGLKACVPAGGRPPRAGPPLFIGPRDTEPLPGIVIPFGYPNYEDHPAVERPFLGFKGFRHLVDTMARRILSFESMKARKESMACLRPGESSGVAALWQTARPRIRR